MPRNDRRDELDELDAPAGNESEVDPLSPEFLEDLAKDQDDIRKKSGRTDRLKLEVGDDAVIRFLPLRLNKRGHFWRRVAKHWIGKHSVITCICCTKDIYGGDPDHECGPCLLVEKHRESSNRDLADAAYDARARDMISLWALVLERNGRPCRVGTVAEVNLSDKVFNSLLEDYRACAQDKENILDPVHGYSFTIKREKKNETTLKMDRKPSLAIGRDARDAEEMVAEIVESLRIPKIRFPDGKEEDEFYDKLKDHLNDAKSGRGSRDRDREDDRGRGRDRDDRGEDRGRNGRRSAGPDDLGEDDAPRGRRDDREEEAPRGRREDPKEETRSRREDPKEETRTRREDPKEEPRERRRETPREEEAPRGRREEEAPRERRRDEGDGDRDGDRAPRRESRREEIPPPPARGRKPEDDRGDRSSTRDDDRAPREERRESRREEPRSERREERPREEERTTTPRDREEPAPRKGGADRDDLDEDENVADERTEHVQPAADDIPMKHEGDANPDEVPPRPASTPREGSAGGTRSANGGMAARLKSAADKAGATGRRTAPEDVEGR